MQGQRARASSCKGLQISTTGEDVREKGQLDIFQNHDQNENKEADFVFGYHPTFIRGKWGRIISYPETRAKRDFSKAPRGLSALPVLLSSNALSFPISNDWWEPSGACSGRVSVADMFLSIIRSFIQYIYLVCYTLLPRIQRFRVV